MNKFKGLLAAAALVAAVLTPSAAQSAPLVVPKTAWPVCSDVRITYCIESATVQSIGGVAEPLVWTPVAESKTYGGLWTTATWATSHPVVEGTTGYDGLFFNVKAANAFTNHLSIDVLPATKAGVLAEGANKGYATSLSPDDIVTFTARIGEILPGVSIGVGSSINLTTGTGDNGATLTFSGTAVPVAEAANKSSCSNETGVAVNDGNELGAFMIVENDDQGFGVDGLSGKMNITSNGTCETSTPTWDSNTGSLTWSASAPHFKNCLLYTSPSPRDYAASRMPSSA